MDGPRLGYAILIMVTAHEGRDLQSTRSAMHRLSRRKATQKVREGANETLAYYHFLREHWRQIRTNNPLERIMCEIRQRSHVVGCFPDGNSALMLAAARLRHIAGTRTRWGKRRYINMSRLGEMQNEVLAEAG